MAHSIITGRGELPCIQVKNETAEAEIYLHGAHLTRFQPHDSRPVLWTSPTAVYRTDKAIRGGVPLVWPWFGPHPTDPTLPQHGLARLAAWQIDRIIEVDEGQTNVVLTLASTPETAALWPHPFALEMRFEIGRTLRIGLHMTHLGQEPAVFGAALHTYLAVGDIEQVEIYGLEGKSYIDQSREMDLKMQEGPLRIEEEVDRVYLASGGRVILHDGAWERHLVVTTDPLSSDSTVVWNPWVDKSARLSDFPNDGYREMVCIETANAADDMRTLAPGDSHLLAVSIEWAS